MINDCFFIFMIIEMTHAAQTCDTHTAQTCDTHCSNMWHTDCSNMENDEKHSSSRYKMSLFKTCNRVGYYALHHYCTSLLHFITLYHFFIYCRAKSRQGSQGEAKLAILLFLRVCSSWSDHNVKQIYRNPSGIQVTSRDGFPIYYLKQQSVLLIKTDALTCRESIQNQPSVPLSVAGCSYANFAKYWLPFTDH